MTSTETFQPKIEILPEHIIDQIKAGEVLERPASLVKELIENSLDAKATEIHLHLVENGMDLLSIEDNGIGISFDNLPYAFLRHATSKLKNYEDLFKLYSFGFRGEALASVAASARVTCTTQPQNRNFKGGKIVINGGHQELLIEQVADHHGTSIFIKDLFYNTPARLKFIKSKSSEKSALKKIIYSFVLAHPQVLFTIKWDDKDKEIYSPVEDHEQHLRVAQVFYHKKITSEDLVECDQTYDQYQIKIFYTKSTYTTPQHRHHYLFANKRIFQDKTLHQAVLRNLESFWRFGESGHYYIDIKVPPNEIDVNVHPNKTQVKFMKNDIVYSLLVTSIKASIKTQREQSAHHSFPVNEEQPMDFLSQEQRENSDLQRFEDYQSHHHFFSNPNISPTLESHSQLFLEKLTDRFWLIRNQEYFILDMKKFLAIFFITNLETNTQLEETCVPLLISEPFRIPSSKVDIHFNSLKKIGFEFDRLNAEYIVLRTIPKFLPQNLVQFFATVLLEMAQNKSVQFTQMRNHSNDFCNLLILNSDFEILPGIIEKYIAHEERDSFLVKLSDQTLLSLFKT
jgi:DNA mismatch repair protein MutL